MIKRYTPSGTGMVEWDGGDYVRYDEHQEIMESIGAGGVSGRVDVVNSMVDMLKEASAKADKEAIDAHDDYGQDVANVYKCVAWRVKVLLARAEQIRDNVANKTIEQHRAEFEEWVASEFKGGVLDKEMIARYAGNNDLYHHSQTSQLWRAWQAARGLKP